MPSPEETLWYKCNDDAASTVVTNDGTGSNGTASVNTSTLSVASFVDASLNKAFDFTSQKITTTLDASGYSDFSVTFFVDFDALGGGGADQIFNNDIGSGASNELVIDTTGSNIRAYMNLSTGGAQIATGSTTLSLGTTYHIAVVWNSTTETLNIYLNANSTPEATKDLSAVTPVISNDVFVVGQRSGGTAQDFDGTLDDIRVYNAALTTDQIALLYNSGAGSESSLADLEGGGGSGITEARLNTSINLGI